MFSSLQADGNMSILVIGSGITGAASAALLRRHLPEKISISIWEKAREPGGRMSITRCLEDPTITADLGAQYITLTNEYSAKRQSLYDELQSQRILSLMHGQIEGSNHFNQAGAQHFVAPHGTSSLVKYFLQKANASVKYQQRVSEISFDTGSQVSVTTHDDITEDFNAVILTLPVPQILQLRGSLHESLGSHPGVKKKLLNVIYSSRYAVGLFYPPGTDLKYPWCAKYISDNPCVRYVAMDQAKRGVVDPNHGQSVVVHTSVPYGLAHLEDDLDKVQSEILDHVRHILPELLEPLSAVTKRWHYSQVHQAYEGRPGCITLSTDPLVILAGDAFSVSTFDGCLDSAESVLKAVTDNSVFNLSS